MMEESNKVERLKQYINHQTSEIPCLIIRKTKGYGDFKTEDLYLESRGYTIDEAKEGLNKLIKELKSLR